MVTTCSVTGEDGDPSLFESTSETMLAEFKPVVETMADRY